MEAAVNEHADGLEPIHTTQDVADRLGVSPAAIRTAINRGQLRASMPFGRQTGYRITETWVREWLDATSQNGSTPPIDDHPAGGAPPPSA